MARVTSENFAERLLRSAEQAAAIKRGVAEPALVVKRKITARKVTVAEAPRYDPARIMGLRKSLAVSQAIFAGMVGVRPVTVKAWEQGQKEPNGSARRLLQILETRPAAVVEAAGLKEAGVAVLKKTGSRGSASGASKTRTVKGHIATRTATS